MTEFDYEVKERKALVPSSRRKKNGIKSKKCTLPMDYMTKGEIKKMNGELVSINLNKPYTLKELKQFPLNLQKEYIQNLREKFCMSIRMFCQMAETSYCTADKYFKETLGIKLSKSLQASYKQREEFNQFAQIAQRDHVEEVVEQIEDKKDAPATEPKVVTGTVIELTSRFVPPMSATLTYTGNVKDVCESLVYALGANSNGYFQITFTSKAEVGLE